MSINHQDSVAAVVGLQMQYRTFYELFMESTKLCDDDKDVACNYTCQSDVSNFDTDLGANYKKILRLSYDVIITYDNRKSNLR